MRVAGARSTQRPHLSHHLVTVPLVSADEADQRAAELWSHGAVGVEELDHALRAAFPAAEDARRARDALAPEADIEVVDDAFGLDEARDLLTVEVAGRFAVHPPWLTPPPDRRGLEIDPGHAFGSGSHVSTRLALTLLDDTVVEGDRVFDIGCGTGVLAIAAALLGARVTAVDDDPAAIEATTANAARNRVADAVAVHRGSADAVAGTVDLVLVNVTIDIHEALAPILPPSSGRMIVAGLLGPSQLDRCVTAYDATVVRTLESDGWMAALLTRS